MLAELFTAQLYPSFRPSLASGWQARAALSTQAGNPASAGRLTFLLIIYYRAAVASCQPLGSQQPVSIVQWPTRAKAVIDASSSRNPFHLTAAVRLVGGGVKLTLPHLFTAQQAAQTGLSATGTVFDTRFGPTSAEPAIYASGTLAALIHPGQHP
ncbi:hypothetical protein T492DRAFT_1124595 [Pavlovales sp. CCMP2436]|nr:hypothetical protein T492DRAFT_1124595 [Pavlovales sp. CCMP2436]